MVTPACAVMPEGSKGGETSTTSAPTMLRPRSSRSICLGLEGGEAADFGRAGARRIGGVQHVDVEAHIGRTVADDLAGFRHDGLGALLDRLLDADEAHAHLRAPLISSSS